MVEAEGNVGRISSLFRVFASKLQFHIAEKAEAVHPVEELAVVDLVDSAIYSAAWVVWAAVCLEWAEWAECQAEVAAVERNSSLMAICMLVAM